MKPRTIRQFLFFSLSIPFALIVASYVWLATTHDTLALAGVIVHESGRYSLTETVFYYSHFLREIPTDVSMALFSVAAFREVFGPAERTLRRSMLGWICAAGGVALALVAFVESARAHGTASTWLDLLQHRTRDDASAYGSHWHYHLASTVWFAVGAPVALRLLAAVSNVAPTPAAQSQRRRSWIAAWTFFAGLTFVFGVSPLVITSVLYTGHQARELATHVPITMLLVFAALASVDANDASPGGDTSVAGRLRQALRPSPIRVAVALAIPLALAAVTLSGDVMGEGQSAGGLAAMVGGHVFEHVLDYAFTPLVAVAASRALATRPST